MGASARVCVPSANVKHDRACNAQQVLAICNKSSIEAEAINNAAILVIPVINNAVILVIHINGPLRLRDLLWRNGTWTGHLEICHFCQQLKSQHWTFGNIR